MLTNCISLIKPSGPLTVLPMEGEGAPLTSTSGEAHDETDKREDEEVWPSSKKIKFKMFCIFKNLFSLSLPSIVGKKTLGCASEDNA